MMKKEKASQKVIMYGALFLLSPMLIGSEQNSLLSTDKVSVELVNTHDSFSEGIKIGNKKISNSILLSLEGKDRERLKNIARPHFIAGCCAGINNQRIKESDIITITKITNKAKNNELKKAIDGMVVEAIDVKNSCCLNNNTQHLEGRLMGSNLLGCCAGFPFVIGGICIPNKCCCIAALPVGIITSLAIFFGVECCVCMDNHYCSEQKTYKFSLDKNEVNQQEEIIKS